MEVLQRLASQSDHRTFKQKFELSVQIRPFHVYGASFVNMTTKRPRFKLFQNFESNFKNLTRNTRRKELVSI